MKIVVLSDSHDNIVRLKHVIGFVESVGANAIIHCGDWNTPRAVKQFEGVKIPVFGVLGNADIDPEIKIKMQKSKIKYEEDFLELKLDGRIIGVCHYPPSPAATEGQALQRALESGRYDLLLHGHTHQKRDEKIGKTRVINPGALERTLKPSFAVYDTESDKVEFVEVAV